MARKTLTQKGVEALKPRAKLYAYPDPQCPGHYVRVTPAGHKSFVAVARDSSGKQKWMTIGNAAHLDVGAARKRAREVINAVKDGKDPAGPQSFAAVANEWFERHAERKGLISTPALRSYLNRYLSPAWSGRDFESIRRGDITKLLDKIEDKSGARSADCALGLISSMTAWYAVRHDDYDNPIVRGMKRVSQKETARKRILSDDEIRLVWSKAEGGFGDLVKLLLLTGQRRHKVAAMKWDDISEDGVWNVPQGEREKGTAGDLPLSPMALEIIRSRPRFVSNPHVFPARGKSSCGRNFDRGQKQLNEATGPLPHWQLHDLRRTARSLMSRAGVRPDIAERVLGHVQPGVEGVYDRHQYTQEKAYALKALAGLIDRIVNPPTANVVSLSRAQ